MRSLPSGKVTLLFTDIDGSTRLLRALGDRYADALDDHRRKLRTVFDRHGGIEVDTQGDAFFVVFDRASDAAAAAVGAQRALAAAVVSVRIGLHTGRPQVTDEGYVGIDVHRAARIATAGHGGQVLVSRSAAESLLVGGEFDLRDLGEHRLKDLPEAEWLYQLSCPGVGRDFPPLRSLGNTNLPTPGKRLVDRERALADVCDWLRNGDARVVSLTGTGGTGKTRLAVQVGLELVGDFPNGVFFVGLASLADAGQVIPSIAQTLGVRQSVDEPIIDTLGGHLGMRRLLLVLDNFEHVMDAAADVSRLIRGASGLTVLATSREALRIEAEREYPLAPLEQQDAVELFGDRARSVEPAFRSDPATEEICRRLDGLPLAIELAAARIKLFPPAEMLRRLERRLPLLTGGGRDMPLRQRTLRSAIDWSYELLPADEQQLFRRLAVFAGGCDLDAVEAVCDGHLERLESLVQKSLVLQRPTPAGQARCMMLAIVREYAEELLIAAGEESATKRRHVAYVVDLIESAEPHLLGRDQVEWLDRLGREIDNIRAAVTWLLATGQPDPALRIVAALIDFWDARGSYQEARGWLERGLADLPDADPGGVRGKALLAAGSAAFQTGDTRQADALTTESVTFARAAGDARLLSRALSQQAGIAMLRGAFDQTVELATAAIAAADAGHDPAMRAFGLNMLAVGTYELGDRDQARERFAEAGDLLREVGDRRNLAILQGNLAGAALLEGDYRSATALFDATIALAEELGDDGRLPSHHQGMATAALLDGDIDTAVSHLSVALVDGRHVGDTPTVIGALVCVAAAAESHGNRRLAALLRGAVERAATDRDIQLSGSDVLIDQRMPMIGSDRADVAWQSEFARGRALALEDAVDHALGALDELRHHDKHRSPLG